MAMTKINPTTGYFSRRRDFAIGLMLVVPSTAFCKQIALNSSQDAAILERMVVRARGGEPADLTTSATEVEKATLAESKKSDLDKVLRGLPGVTLLRTTRGALSAFALRGANAGQGQLILDGVPLYATVPTLYNLDAFAPEMLEDAEIVRGASAIRYGSLAPGGTLRLFSRDDHESGAAIHLQGGSYGTLSETATATLAGEKARATVTGKHEDVFDGISQANEKNGNRERDGFKGNLSLFRYSAQPVERLNLNGTLYYSRTKADIDGFGLLPDGQPGLVDDFSAFGLNENWVAQQTAKFDLTPNWQSSFQAGFNRSYARVRVNNVTGDSDSTLGLLRWRNRHVLQRGTVAGDGLDLTWSVEGREEQGKANSLLGAFADKRGQLAGQADLDASYGRWTFAGGARVDRYDGNGTHGVYYLGASYLAHRTLNIRASGGHVYRLPTYQEWHFPFFGNPFLKPEASNGGELGFDWTPNNGTRISATGFYHRYKNLIRVSFVPQLGHLVSSNMPEAEVSGIEADTVFKIESFTAGVVYTFQYSRNIEAGGEIPRLPEHQGKIFGEWRAQAVPVAFGAEIIYRSGYFDDLGQTLRIGNAWTVNLQAVYSPIKALQVYVRGENVLDNRTPDDFSYGTPGAAVYGGIKLSYR